MLGFKYLPKYKIAIDFDVITNLGEYRVDTPFPCRFMFMDDDYFHD